MNTAKLTRVVGSALLLAAGFSATAADHREAPLIQTDGRADINDVYAYTRGPDSIVVAMTVNPLAAPEEASTYTFDPNVAYDFHFDANSNGRANRIVRVTFSDPVFGPQTFTVRMPGGATEFSGPVTASTPAPDPNPAAVTTGPNGELAFAGPRDDPFFFDIVGFQRFLGGIGGFSGTDGFAGKNVSAIVLELPIDAVAGGNNTLEVWGTTSRRRVTVRGTDDVEASYGPYRQIERMGNPAVNTALIPTELKDLYNVGTPETDAAAFAESIVASLTALGTNDENIGILASVAVPDTLKIDLDAPPGYPNGRRFGDDVVDTLFFFIFNQTAVPDGVDANDKPFLDVFPYLAAPHQPPA